MANDLIERLANELLFDGAEPFCSRLLLLESGLKISFDFLHIFPLRVVVRDVLEIVMPVMCPLSWREDEIEYVWVIGR